MAGIIEVKDLYKKFLIGKQEVEVIKGISLKINEGDFAIIFGPSGCGKSTLLHSVIGLERPTSGIVEIEGKDIYAMTEDEMVSYRKRKVGMVFQQPIWIKSLSVLENAAVPGRLLGKTREEAEKAAFDKLALVKLENWGNRHPSELSSGQQQRVSLARALTIDPSVIIADEPTGNLDTVSGDELMDLLGALNKEKKVTMVMVTHDLEYLKYATKLFHIIDGKLVEEYDQKGAYKMAAKLKTKKGLRGKVTVQDSNYLSGGKANG
jgi:putative ABC transport system ATP-binding protein